MACNRVLKMKYAQINSTIKTIQPVLGYYDTGILDYPNLPSPENLIEMSEADWELRLSNNLDYFNGKFSIKVPAAPTADELRQSMTLSAAQARIRLARAGLLMIIVDYMNELPDDAELKILWEYETMLHRLNPILCDFCKTTLGMSDEQIDGLFTN
jgi:hypothetical protein